MADVIRSGDVAHGRAVVASPDGCLQVVRSQLILSDLTAPANKSRPAIDPGPAVRTAHTARKRNTARALKLAARQNIRPPQAWHGWSGKVPRSIASASVQTLIVFAGNGGNSGNNGGFPPGSGVSEPTAALATVATVMPRHLDRMRGPLTRRGEAGSGGPPSIGRTAPMRTMAASLSDTSAVARFGVPGCVERPRL